MNFIPEHIKNDPLQLVFDVVGRTNAGVIDSENPLTITDESIVTAVLRKMDESSGTGYRTTNADFSRVGTVFTFVFNKSGGVELATGLWLWEIQIQAATADGVHAVANGLFRITPTL